MSGRNEGRSEPAVEREEQEEIRRLRDRDREVRAHESAHLAAGSGLAQGGASLTYERGPDGRMYAVGGEVKIDTSAVAGDPGATLRKAEQIRRAALAPAQPSSQDRQVAAEAVQMAAEARAEIADEKRASPDSPIGRYREIEAGLPESRGGLYLTA